MEINLSFTDEIALITMDDGKKNAITLDALKAINTALDEAGEAPTLRLRFALPSGAYATVLVAHLFEEVTDASAP